jgi:hypothetical protein
MVGWSRAKFYRALREAQDHGFLTASRSEDGVKVAYLTSLYRLALRYGIAHLGSHSIVVSAKALRAAKTLRAACLVAFHSSRHGTGPIKPSGRLGRPISRERIKQLTGISRATQLGYEKLSRRVRVQRNALVLPYGPNALRAARDEVHGACYVQAGHVVRPLPNSYRTEVPRAGWRGLKKANRKLRAVLLHNRDEGQRPDFRAFFTSVASAKNAFRDAPARERGGRSGGPSVAYGFLEASPEGIGLWTPV